MNYAIRGCVAGLSLAFAVPSFACSICRCGDPTFNALGEEGVAQTGLRVAFDWDQVRKTQGDEDVDSLRERRYSVLAAYGFSDTFSVFARLPYSERDLTETEDGETEHESASGLADPEIYAQWRLWASPFEGDVGMRASIYLVGGVKTSWGENDVSRGGERLDEHVQPGTGSNDWFAGVSGSYQLDPKSALFVSTQYRHTGRNDAGYRYGRTSLVNVAYERKLTSRWDAVLEANYRHAGRDEIDDSGLRDTDTGGSIVYLTPRVLFDLGSGWVARASAQVPLSQSGLNGAQDEKTVFNVGITRLFSK
jgi:hypothetical protein